LTAHDLIRRFLEAEGREKKSLLKELLQHSLTREQVTELAPAIRDPSPRVSSRITSLLARWHLKEVFEEQLKGLKPGKQSLLRGHFLKLSGPGGSTDENSEETNPKSSPES
jgi:hypothetical protein